MWHSLLNVSAFRQQKDLKVANQQIMDDVHVLGIKIKVDGGLAKVEWKFKLTKRRGRMTQAFKLPSDGFHPNSPQFNISCSYSTNRSGTCNGCYEFKVNFSLNQAKSPHQDDVENQDKSIAILARVDYNDSEKFPLMELQCSDKLNAWKSKEEIQIDASCCRQPKTKDDSLRARFSQCLWLARYGCTSAISAPTFWRFSNLVQTFFSSKLIAIPISLSKTVRQLELTKMF